MSDFDLTGILREIHRAAATQPYRLGALASTLAQRHAEKLAELDAAGKTIAILRGHGVDEARDFAERASNDYCALRALFVDLVRVVIAEHDHLPGAGADPTCPMCRITAAVPLRIYADAVQGADQ
jgi:hypothetical protein